MRILVAIASYGTRNDGYLSELVREYRSMPFDVDIVVLSNVSKEVAPGVEVVVVNLRGKDPWSLPFPHKKIFADRQSGYDLFIYSEDDVLISERNIKAFLKACSVLPEDEIPGFFRFERGASGETNYPDVHGCFHWDCQSVRRRGESVFASFTNAHSACYVLTRRQLQKAIASGGFLVGPHRGRYDLLCTAATDPYTQCGFQKVVGISDFDDFLIHHLPNKYVGSRFGVNELELRRQVAVLLQIGRDGCCPRPIFPTESKLMDTKYSAHYYRPIADKIISAIPNGVRSVLSIGCGWGATEASLVEKGLRVVAIPLDPVIADSLQARGVEMIHGDYQSAREKLRDERFDCCLLLSNVLHLVPDPIDVLASFRDFLSDRGVLLLLVPNVPRLSTYWAKIWGNGHVPDLGSYEKTGVHATSHRIVRGWFRNAGWKPGKIIDILPPRAKRIGRLTLGVTDPLLSSEFIAVATKV